MAATYEIVAAVAANGVIGLEGKLPWRLPPDLRRFRDLTMGKVVVMGRRTFEGLPTKLEGRRLIVLTSERREHIVRHNVAVVRTDDLRGLPDRLAALVGVDHGPIMVAGGAAVYRLFLPHASRLHLTRIDVHPKGDTFFPALDWRDWTLEKRETFPREGDLPAYGFFTYSRRSP